MATGTTAYGDISPRTATFSAMDFLTAVDNHIVIGPFGTPRPMPKNKGQVIVFRRPVPYPAVTTPLQEGITPPPRKFRYENVSMTLKQWGDVAELTDVIADTHEDPVLKHMMKMAGQQAGATIEQVTYGVVKAGTTVYYANGAARNAVNTPVTLNKLRAVSRGLMTQKAAYKTMMVAPGPDYGTSAIEPGYVAIVHTHLVHDIRELPGFIPVAKYGQRQKLHPREFGCVEDFRFISSADLDPWTDQGGGLGLSGVNMVSTSGVNSDVYPILVFGEESFGLVPLKGDPATGDVPVTPIVLNPNNPAPGDPLGQRGTVGWKTWFNAVILNDAWMARLEVAATAL